MSSSGDLIKSVFVSNYYLNFQKDFVYPSAVFITFFPFFYFFNFSSNLIKLSYLIVCSSDRSYLKKVRSHLLKWN